MKTSNTFICLTLAITVITGCNNQTTEQTEETNTNTDTTSQEINTEDTAGQRPAMQTLQAKKRMLEKKQILFKSRYSLKT